MGVTVRDLAPGDRPAVDEILHDCRAFSETEIRVALEMVDAGLAGDYSLFAAEVDGQLRGYACFGRAYLTASSWYLYWICVDRRAQGTGIGRALQEHVEDLVRALGGERLVLETSARADYARARHFYRAGGFVEVGRIAEFYGPTDDCLIYCKRLGTKGTAR
jgi:ribosomal protein S18 acetylase RimI-like enzyme